MKMLHAKNDGTLKWSGGRLFVRAGQTIDREHPVVVEVPDAFEEREVLPDIPAPGPARRKEDAVPEPPVERGTRAPGERRAGRLRTVTP